MCEGRHSNMLYTAGFIPLLEQCYSLLYPTAQEFTLRAGKNIHSSATPSSTSHCPHPEPRHLPVSSPLGSFLQWAAVLGILLAIIETASNMSFSLFWPRPISRPVEFGPVLQSMDSDELWPETRKQVMPCVCYQEIILSARKWLNFNLHAFNCTQTPCIIRITHTQSTLRVSFILLVSSFQNSV